MPLRPSQYCSAGASLSPAHLHRECCPDPERSLSTKRTLLSRYPLSRARYVNGNINIVIGLFCISHILDYKVLAARVILDILVVSTITLWHLRCLMVLVSGDGGFFNVVDNGRLSQQTLK